MMGAKVLHLCFGRQWRLWTGSLGRWRFELWPRCSCPLRRPPSPPRCAAVVGICEVTARRSSAKKKKEKIKGEINALPYEFWNRLNKSVCIFHTKNKNMGPSGLNYIKAAGITFDCLICFHHSQKRENKYIKSSENSVKWFVLEDVEPVCCCCWPLYCWSASACRKRFPASSSEHRCWEIRGGRTFCYLKNWKITESISRQEK